MKKHGFTLAEVLLSLAIVGILAAITIPQIAIGVEKRKAGAIVGRATEQISLGCQNYIQAYNDKQILGGYTLSLNDIDEFDQFNLEEMKTYMDLTDPFLSESDKEKDTKDWQIFSKSPAYIKLSESNDKNFDVYIDANGFSGKNTVNFDQYQYKLTNTCKMIPVSDNAIELTGNEFRYVEKEEN